MMELLQHQTLVFFIMLSSSCVLTAAQRTDNQCRAGGNYENDCSLHPLDSLTMAVVMTQEQMNQVLEQVSQVLRQTTQMQSQVNQVQVKVNQVQDQVNQVQNQVNQVQVKVNQVQNKVNQVQDQVIQVQSNFSQVNQLQDQVSLVQVGMKDMHMFVGDGLPLTNQDCGSKRGTIGPMAMRLVGDSMSRGRLEVKHNGVWGTVCDDGFTNTSAAVFCKSFGFTSNSAYFKNGPEEYRTQTGLILLDNIRCFGSETDATCCTAAPWGNHNCGHHEDVALYCD